MQEPIQEEIAESSNILQEQQVEQQENESMQVESALTAKISPVTSFQIDSNFTMNIKNGQTQQDFLKGIEVFNQGKYVHGVTEQMNLKIFQLQDNNQLVESISKRFPQPIYDSVMMNNRQGQDIIAVSIKNQPINVYRVESNSSGIAESLKNIGYLSSQKKNTEQYQTPLQFKHEPKKGALFGVGKQFVGQYDLGKFCLKDSYEKYNKNEIISCLDISESGVLAIGKFDRKVEIMDFSNKKITSSFGIHLGGVTCVKFNPNDGNYLFSGARKDNLIYKWDLRKQDTFVSYYSRSCTTNQRMGFDVCQGLLAFGEESGQISIVDIVKDQILGQQQVHQDTVNSVAFYLNQESLFLASSSGSRKYALSGTTEDEDDDDSSSDSDGMDEDDNNTPQPTKQGNISKKAVKPFDNFLFLSQIQLLSQ